MIISLIGYRGTGKSTVGRQLAAALSLPFFDSDQVIVEKAGHSISEIFAAQGEAAFRKLESEAVEELIKVPQGVIAWGGGVVLAERNRQAIRRSQRTIWLCATPETLIRRLLPADPAQPPTADANRPPLTDLPPESEIRLNLEKREALYRTCADEYINVDDLTVEEIVEQIIRGLDAKRIRLAHA